MFQISRGRVLLVVGQLANLTSCRYAMDRIHMSGITGGGGVDR